MRINCSPNVTVAASHSAIFAREKGFIESPSRKKWIHPADTTKWLALIDVCRDCRLVTGTHAVPWLYVPKDHMTPPLPDDLLIGMLRIEQRRTQDILRNLRSDRFRQPCQQTAYLGRCSGHTALGRRDYAGELGMVEDEWIDFSGRWEL
ncbi:uncharacterized protein BDV17DRAFT_271892 [Aspergillus undulatus]|uniref:uncharacterized protein n=1 Tax=Aspergillus undulatus TaxID=1810928 RepID=UPI003CCD31C0